MIDYAFKSEIIKSGLDLFARDISSSYFYNFYPSVNKVPTYSYKMAKYMEEYFFKNFGREYVEAKKINHAFFERVTRLRKYITLMLSMGDCIFLTFTFTDFALKSLSAKTRRTYVQRYLSNYDTLYVGNIDFGKKNHREHYHAVIRADKVDPKKWRCGSLNMDRVKSSSDSVKLAKYISKLTNHAIKETTKRSSLIYSRKKIEMPLYTKPISPFTYKNGQKTFNGDYLKF